MTNKPAEKPETLALAGALLADMVMELHFRGCDDNHPLILRAGELIPLLRQTAAADGTQAPHPPEKLHLMTAEAVSLLDLTDLAAAGLCPHTQEELAEAAFSFENELMALLGDDNTMPMEAYSGMAENDLKGVIRAAVENICRLRAS